MNITLAIAAIALSAVAAIAAAPVSAESTTASSTRPLGTVFEVYVYACQPVEYDFAGARHPLSEAGLLIHDEVFASEYANNCRDFYLGEIASRVVPTVSGAGL